jgi:hypothetical protein
MFIFIFYKNIYIYLYKLIKNQVRQNKIDDEAHKLRENVRQTLNNCREELAILLAKQEQFLKEM